RLIDLLQRAEANGFECGWTYDAHILWQESFALLPLAAATTTPLEAPRHHDEPVVSADLSDPPGAAPPGGAGVHHHPPGLPARHFHRWRADRTRRRYHRDRRSAEAGGGALRSAA